MKTSTAVHPAKSTRARIQAGAFAALALAASFAPAAARAQVAWTGLDDRGPLWSYGRVVDPMTGKVLHVGNWSNGGVPGGGDVLLGAPADTNCDVQASLNSLTVANGGELLMDWTSSLNVTSTNIATDGTLAFNTFGGGAFPIFTNTGTFRKSAGAGLYSVDSGIVFNSLPGSVIQVDSGSLQLPGNDGLFDTMTFNTAAGTLIDLVPPFGNSGGRNFFQGTLTNTTGVGTVRLSTNTLAGKSGGSPCTLAFPGNVFQWTGGYIGDYQQGAVFTNTGTVTLAGGAVKFNQANFTNLGTVIQTDTGNLSVGTFGAGGNFTNAAGAVYDLRSDAGFDGTIFRGSAFTNAGLFKKSAGSGVSLLDNAFSLTGGTIEVDSGTLQLQNAANITGGASTGGTFIVAANALLDLGNQGHFTGTYTGSGAGTVRLSAGELDGNYRAGASQTTFNFPPGLFQWTGGTIGEVSIESFTNAGTMTLSGAAGKQIIATFTNAGTLVQTGAGAFDTGHFGTSGVFVNAAGALYDLQSDAGVAGDDYSPSAFKNAGTFQKSGGTGTSAFVPGLKNSGTVAVKTGTLAFANTLYDIAGTTLTGGTWNVYDGATLTFTKYASLTVNQGSVTLSGPNAQFPALAGLADSQGSLSLLAQRQFTTAGALSNEGTLTLDAGSTLHVAGGFTASAASKLAFTVGGTASSGAQSPGILQADGAGALAGTLAVSFSPAAALPANGDTLTVLSAANPVAGSFANAANGARLATADGKGSFQVSYGAGNALRSVTLSQFLAAGATPTPTPILLPVLTLTADMPNANANEGTAGSFLLTRTGDLSQDLRVAIQIRGSATDGTDYPLLSTTKKLKAGHASKRILIYPVDESFYAGGKRTVKVTLLPGAGYSVGAPATAKIKIFYDR